MRVLHIHGNERIHANERTTQCWLHYIWQYCTLYDSTALHLTVLHSTALCGGCNCVVRGCTSSSVGLVTSQQPGPAFQNLHTETPHTLTLLHSVIFTLTSEQCSVEICCFTPLHGYTQLNSVIFTLSWAVQWAPAISFTLYTDTDTLYMDNTDKRAVQWAEAISFSPLRG